MGAAFVLMIGGRFAAGDRLNEFEEAVGGGWSWTSSAEFTAILVLRATFRQFTLALNLEPP